MAALTGFRRLRPVALLAMAIGAAGAGLAEPPAARDRAEQAFLEADFESALTAARAAVDDLAPEGAALPEGERRERLVRALDLVAESLFNLGDEKGAREVLARLVDLEPGYRVEEAIAGAQFVRLLEAVRSERVGWVRLACRPLPCEEVVVDGRRLAPDAEGRLALPAGQRRIVVSRHGFRDEEMPALEVTAGRTLDVTVELTQVARDVVLRTEPPGVDVSVDGVPRGTTGPTQGPDGVSAPFVLTELAPGPHVLVLEAPCRRRVEQRLEIVLDAADPGPLDLGTIPLSPARGRVSVAWDREEGTVLLDGTPVGPGTHELCPGVHELAVALGTSRVYVERFTLADGAERSFAPRPRPGIAVAPALVQGFDADAVDGWNLLTLSPAAEQRLAAAARAALGDAPPPIAPRVLRRRLPVDAANGAFPPDAALAALVVDGVGPLARHRVAVLIDPRRGLLEAAAPARGAGDPAAVFSGWLAGTWQPFGSFLGFDLARLDGGPVIVASVTPGSPAAAAGLAPGRVVLAIAGQPVEGADALDALRAGHDGDPVGVTLRSAGGEEQLVELAPVRQLLAPGPHALAAPGAALLPLLARTSLLRQVGRGDERLAAAVWSGLALAALGRDGEAIEALDRAEIPPALDPSRDAAATVGLTLWQMLAALSDPYADEVRARLGALEGARAGGREGPPIAFATAGDGS